MHHELHTFYATMQKATTPEEVFGGLPSTDPVTAAKHLYRQFARLTHEDYHTAEDKPVARLAFTLLTTWWTQTQARIARGLYGTTAPTVPIVLEYKTLRYTVERTLGTGELGHTYLATDRGGAAVIVKIARNAAVNGLLEHEASRLAVLQKASKTMQTLVSYIPPFLNTFPVKDATTGQVRRVLVYAYLPGYVPLTDVRAAFPTGVAPAAFVWMFNRLLTALAFIHDVGGTGFVHGAILPPHVQIHPETHGLMLTEWGYGVAVGSRLSVMARDYVAWYPPEIAAKRPVTAATDLYQAALCMLYVLGGDVTKPTDALSNVPVRFQRFLHGCLLQNPARRPQAAWPLFEQFQTVAEAVLGPKRFVPFSLASST